MGNIRGLTLAGLCLLAGCGGDGNEAGSVVVTAAGTQTTAGLPPMPETALTLTGTGGSGDMTVAGFPFAAGYYVSAGACAADNPALQQFASRSRSVVDEDLRYDFTAIVRIGPGQYRVFETVPNDDPDEEGKERSFVYAADGAGGFSSDEPAFVLDAAGEQVRLSGARHFRPCPESALVTAG